MELDDTYPVGTVDLVIVENGEEKIKENVGLWFAHGEGSWRLGNFNYSHVDIEEEWENALSGHFRNSTKEQDYISEDKALEITKEMNMNNSEDVEWTIEFNENAEIESEKTTAAWIVEAVYPAGNKIVYYIDATSGKPSKVGEIEAP